jgi:tetratricopeptide (TPR) repeat protein
LGAISIFFANNFLFANIYRILALRTLVEVSQQNTTGLQLSGMPCDTSYYGKNRIDDKVIQSALDNLRRANKYQPSNSQTFALSGLAYCMLNEPSISIEMYNRSIELNPSAIWNKVQLVSLYQTIGNQPEVDSLLRRNEIPVDHLLDVSEWYISLEEPTKSEQWLVYASQMEIDNPRLWRLWLSVIQKNKEQEAWSKAIESAEMAIDIQRTNDVNIYKSSFFTHMGEIIQYHLVPPKTADALIFFEYALKEKQFLNPIDNARAHQYLGEIYWSKRPQYTLEQVMTEYQKAYELDPSFSWTPFAIGRVYLLGYHNYPLAQKYFKLSVSLGNEDPIVLVNLGDSYLQNGEIQKAIDSYREALSKDPDNSYYLQKVALAQSLLEPAK